MDDWLNDALSGSEGYERQFIDYVGKAEFNRIQGSQLEAIRREEFDCFIDYCRGQGR